jgi:hypothetical protein
MQTFCLNTGDAFVQCEKKTCAHYDERSASHCLQYLYDRPLTPMDVAHLQGQTYLDARKIQRIAETKIVAWGRVLEGMSHLTPLPFINFLEDLHDHDEDLAVNIAHDPMLFIVNPMQYIKPEFWAPVIQAFRTLLQESGVASKGNKVTWDSVATYNLV